MPFTSSSPSLESTIITLELGAPLIVRTLDFDKAHIIRGGDRALHVVVSALKKSGRLAYTFGRRATSDSMQQGLI